MSTINKPIKLSRIIFEGPIQIAGMTIREYQVLDNMPARYEAHLHGEVQCVALREPNADVTILIPLRLVRSMEVCDKHNIPAASSSSEGMLAMQEQMRTWLKTPPEPPSDEPAARSSSDIVAFNSIKHGRIEKRYDELTNAEKMQISADACPRLPSSDEPRRRGRPRTKHLTPPSDNI